MTPIWRTGSIELLDGYTLTDSAGHHVTTLQGIRFAIEGGYVNIEVPGVPHTQIVSAPAIRLLTCTTTP
ncbi:MAG: hypothetical protein HOV96_22205, partial [Nonomuraea sp.]|nr:hypothetical protein [Nonomuraea sp.]